MTREKIDSNGLELEERVISIKRVTKVVKGGRNFRFAALVVVGDGNGHVGVGTGKSKEVPESIQKAIENAKKHLMYIPRVGTTIPHNVEGRYGSGYVRIMTAKEGTGVIAGGPVRAVLELAGIRDVRAKSIGSNNARNMVNATVDGLMQLTTIERVSALRGLSKEEVLGGKN